MKIFPMFENAAVLLAAGVLTGLVPLAAFAADRAGSSVGTLASPDLDQHQIVSANNLYVRTDIGVAQYSTGGFTQDELTTNGGSFISRSVGDGGIVGLGLGYQINRNFRLDLTAEYRASAQVKAMDNVNAELVAPSGSLQANSVYQGNLTSYVGLVNAYVDLFKWRGLTPYFGAGVGFASNRISDMTTASSATFTDAVTGAVTTQVSNGAAQAKSQMNMAWALMAGTSFDLSPRAKLDVGYRYLSMGSANSASTGLILCQCGTQGQPLRMSDVETHEFRFGLRWSLGSGLY